MAALAESNTHKENDRLNSMNVNTALTVFIH